MTPAAAERAISLVDLTDLTDDCTDDDVQLLCRRARTFGTAAVCVWPDFVATAAAMLVDSHVELATVVDFPTGDERIFSVSGQTERALADGATEIDLVLPYRRFRCGDRDHAAHMVRAIRTLTDGRARLKVILETGELPDLDAVRAAAELAVDEGADFIKTSTGKSPVSATLAAASVMLDVIAVAGRPVGIKPSGGISTADGAAAYIELAETVMGEGWVRPETFRFGASSLLTALLDVAGVADHDARPPDSY